MAGRRPMPALDRFAEKLMPDTNGRGCWLWTATCNNQGYGMFRLSGASMLAHRASWTLHRGQIPDGLLVLHHCDTPACCNPDHLYLGTFKDNTRDIIVRGRFPKTHKRGNQRRKLTEGQVQEIRASQLSQSALAKIHGVTQGRISQLQNRSHA